MEIFRLLFVIAFLALAGCLMNHNDEQPTTGALSFYLSDSELSNLKDKARCGDSAASLRLYRFYDFVELDRSLALQWLKKAAQDGSPQGQYILGKTYLNDITVKDRREAVYWLRQSAANGYPEAQAELDSFSSQ